MTSSKDARAFDLVAIGASAGGLTAVTTVLSELERPFPTAVALVLHLSPDHPSVLPEVLSRSTGQAVQWACDGAQLDPGAVYVAPRGQHLVIDDRCRLALTSAAPVHFSRPSVDCLFDSAARTLGPRVIATLLTGNGVDGAAGALVVRRAGGVVIAQDEATAEFFSMPREAIETGAATLVLPLRAIAAMITRLVRDGRAALEDVAPSWRGTPAVRSGGPAPSRPRP